MNNETIINKLKDGNKQYVKGGIIGDVSKNRRIDTYLNGQSPFALIITCSDSRVIPEVIFQQGIGDLLLYVLRETLLMNLCLVALNMLLNI